MSQIGRILLVVSCLVSWSEAAGGNCGSETTNLCPAGEYCDVFTGHTECKQCSDICEKSRNYNQDQCDKQCKESKSASPPAGDQVYFLIRKVDRLQLQATAALSLACILVVVLGGLGIVRLYQWKRNGNVTLKNLHQKIFSKSTSTNGAQHASGNGAAMSDQGGGRAPDLRLEIPTPGALSENSPVTMTTNVSRMPAEDSIDYAYDNPVMSNSSSPSRLGHIPA